ncbi:MAG: zinc ribbon domain-containing protein [Gemmataceae bacterium]|nr:zinc ribbon domain-containing protein [Gemmataceae bacterium]
MPLYQYKCTACDTAFETLVNRGEKPSCPKCQSKKLDKQPSMIGIPQVKGAVASSCGDLSLPPCGAQGCRRTGK